MSHQQAKLTKVVPLLKKLFKKLLMSFGVGGLASSIATRFTFKYVFKPMAHHFLKKDILKSFTYFDGDHHYVVHKKGVEVVKRSTKKRRVSF